MTNETTPQSTEQPVEKTPEEIAADAAAAEQASQEAPQTPPEGDLDPGEPTADGETEADEDSTVAPEVGGTHHAKHGVLAGSSHSQHSGHKPGHRDHTRA